MRTEGHSWFGVILISCFFLLFHKRIQRAGIREHSLGIPGYLPMSNGKGAGRMPWLREATKDAASGEMPRGGAGFL